MIIGAVLIGIAAGLLSSGLAALSGLGLWAVLLAYPAGGMAGLLGALSLGLLRAWLGRFARETSGRAAAARLENAR
jgi:hypothetical protein